MIAMRHLILATLLACGVAAAQTATERQIKVDITPQPLRGALAQLAEQTGVQLLFSEDEVLGDVKAPRVVGTYTLEAALKQLLAQTSLRAEFINARTVSIRTEKGGKKTTGLRPMDQMRMAVADASAGTGTGEEKPRQDTKDQVTVEGRRDKKAPFSDGNADIPRTIDDAQPYYVFDAATINMSGATSVEDFLKQRLTMNTLVWANGERAATGQPLGNTSTVNLRGLGADKTLILVNGRRVAGVKSNNDTDYQPDLNGIPVSAIDRIEVLPSSASGIYGGSAIGGVVNVILKRDFSGGEVRVAYDDTWDGASPRRTLNASYGMSLEGGRTKLTLGASWSDAESLILRDRADMYRGYLNQITGRAPTFIYSSSTPWLGLLPNIFPPPGPLNTLTLRNGVVLNTRNTHVPAGTTASTPANVLRQGLIDNAGTWNLDFAPTTQSPTGLLRPFGQTPQSRTLRVGLRRQMTDRLELFADFSFGENSSHSIYNTVGTVSVPAPDDTLYPNMVNPFNHGVSVLIPDAAQRPQNTVSQTRSMTLGALLQLPGGWVGMLDYSGSENRFDYNFYLNDGTAMTADIRSGALNVFVDNLAYPADFMKYAAPNGYEGSNRLHDISLRASGPLPALPWGQARLTVGLEHRLGVTPQRTQFTDYPLSPAFSTRTNYFRREQVTDSAYAEATVPLVKTDVAPGIHALDLQLSGRGERFKVDTGTNYEQFRYNTNPPTVSYNGQVLNGQPYFSDATYDSTNYTVGLKYQPVREIILRASQATAFLPPTPAQLLQNLLPSPSRNASVLDPTRPAGQQNALVYTLGGGNPDLVPQNSRSFNAGIVWTPESRALSGLRLNAEYYRIRQFDAIGTLTLQQIVNLEAVYPERVQRESNGALYLVDISALNLYRRETEGMDFSVDYRWQTGYGAFSLSAVESIVLHLKDQVSLTLPEVDATGFPSEGGAAKYKSNGTLGWEGRNWRGSWTSRYTGSYRQYGAPGGPASRTGLGGFTNYLVPQGATSIPSQIYHDLFVGYSFDGSGSAPTRQSARRELMSGLAFQLGVRNVFNKAPPLDAFYGGNYFLSPYGDVRLRSYWLNLTKTF